MSNRSPLLIATAALLVGLGSTACKPLPPPPPELQTIRACDASVCLFAQEVVDSDGDGFSDADEQVAGTDPFDAGSRPPLQVVVELAVGRKLPSFEAGLAFVQVMPADIQAMREAGRELPAPPAIEGGPERADSLTRFGISSALLTQNGIDPERDGFTLGLQPPTADGSIPERRVGGVEVRLISADEDLEPIPDLPYGGIVKEETVDGDRFTTYGDGTVKAEWGDGGFTYMDKDGKVIYSGYVNPDADTTSAPPTDEDLERWKRMHQATVRTVDGWAVAALESLPPQDPGTVIHLDPELATEFMTTSDTPRVTSVQPEADPNLPNPQHDGHGIPGVQCGYGGCGSTGG
jgi:hypothetical protein